MIMSDWESIFKKRGKFFYEPHKDMGYIIAFMKKRGVRRILDLGCGSGRHTIALAKAGFDVYGMDSAPSGLAQTKQWLKQLHLSAQLKRASCYKTFPYKDSFFDAVVSVQVIHHATIQAIRYCITEIERTLKPGGTIFVTVPKTKRNAWRSHSKIIAPRTFVPTDGHEAGVTHYLYTKELLKKDFKHFTIKRLYTDLYQHHCLLGVLKK